MIFHMLNAIGPERTPVRLLSHRSTRLVDMMLVDSASQEAEERLAAFDAALAAAVGRYDQQPGQRSGDSAANPVADAVKESERRLASYLDQLRSLPDGELVRMASRAEQAIAGERLMAAARSTGSTGNRNHDKRRARTVLEDPGRSKRSVNADAARAAAIAANDLLADEIGGGTITPESIDALIKAADEVSGHIPDELIHAVEGLQPDQAVKVVDRYAEATASADEVEEKYRRQNKARRVYRYTTQAGNGQPSMAGIAIEGPDAVIDHLWTGMDGLADGAYQAVGGRELPNHLHKPINHRRFDGLVSLVNDGGSKSGAQATAGRASVVVTIDGAQLIDDPDNAVATQIGSGPISRQLLEQYLHHGSLATLLTGTNGAPLWLGRTRRNSTSAQFLALAVRDRGCVLCSAGINRCQAHHLMPWTAPGRGQTDITNMALLCRRCHQDLHHRNHTLYRINDGRSQGLWATRPATAEEQPAPRPNYRQRE